MPHMTEDERNFFLQTGQLAESVIARNILGEVAGGAAAASGFGAITGGIGGTTFTAAQLSGVAGVAGSGPVAAGAVINPIALIIVAAFVLYGLLSRPNGKDRRSKGFAFQFRENPSDPNDPILSVYGSPPFAPPILFRYLSSSNLNSINPAKGQTFVECMSLGAGPIDGGGLKVWMDDRIVFEKGEVEEELNALDTPTNKVYAFPHENVVPTSVELFKDGVSVGVGRSDGNISAATPTQSTFQRVTPRKFTSADTDDIITGKRYGGVFAFDGVDISDVRVTIVVKSSATPAAIRFADGSYIGANKTKALTGDAVHLGTLKDGRSYFWIPLHEKAPDGGDFFDTLYVTAKYLAVVAEIENREGTWVAIFKTAQTQKITAIFDSSSLGDHIKMHLRKGDVDQLPLPTDGVRDTTIRGDELLEGIPVTVTTPSDVDDVELVIVSGAEGFFDQAISGGNAGQTYFTARSVRIRIKEDAYTGTGQHPTDPSKGWVTLKHPSPDHRGKPIRLWAMTRGTARWIFSVADLLAYTQGKNPASGQSVPTGFSFTKRTAYDIELMALDAAGGAVVANDLFLAATQSVRRIKLSLPHHATLTTVIDDLEAVSSEPLWRVQVRGRKVWVPDAGAEYDADTGRPEPGNLEWTRNPTWCRYDLVTDPIFGAGQWFPWRNVDLVRALASAAFADATVTGGETRAELDLVIRSRAALWDHVSQMAAGARVFPALAGGTWIDVIDQDEAVSMALTEDDFEYRSIALTLPSLEEVPTDLEAAFTDDETDSDLEPERRGLTTEPAQRVLRRIDLTGVRRRSQVGRVLDLVLAQLQLQKRAIDLLSASWRLLRLEPGDVVTLTSTTTGDAARKYRVMSMAWGAGFRVGLRLAEHDPNAYAAGWQGPNSAIEPGARPPSDATSPASKGNTIPRYLNPITSGPTLTTLTVTRIREVA